ncbi:unnamed protein product [Spirodela intermedia]|uniref:Uncharacterized protein n=1 Tax=Spirodela intermedia TaxID=51605 RepID=A0A7I8JMI3_SPIIN|nr:unnamed protein product [Spirodela intermedia]CAA6671366.1 unnamed protein product [Spirodela intermedia]
MIHLDPDGGYCVYVDDLFVTGSKDHHIKQFKGR